MTEPTELCYPVLTPFKFGGVIVKPPAFVQMRRDAANAYIDAGVISNEDKAALVPDSDAEIEAQRLAKQQDAADQEAEAQRLAKEQTAADEQAVADRKAADEAKAAGSRKAGK